MGHYVPLGGDVSPWFGLTVSLADEGRGAKEWGNDSCTFSEDRGRRIGVEGSESKDRSRRIGALGSGGLANCLRLRLRHSGHGCHQTPGVFVLRIDQNLLCRSRLNDLAFVKNRDAVADAGY